MGGYPTASRFTRAIERAQESTSCPHCGNITMTVFPGNGRPTCSVCLCVKENEATREVIADGEKYVVSAKRYRENIAGGPPGRWARLLQWAKISHTRRRTRRLMEEAGREIQH